MPNLPIMGWEEGFTVIGEGPTFESALEDALERYRQKHEQLWKDHPVARGDRDFEVHHRLTLKPDGTTVKYVILR